MKKYILFIISLLFVSGLYAQETRTVDAKGLGIARADALQDALRNAISQAVGVTMSSQTTVENFVILQDAIASNTQGFITSYDVISEKQVQDNYEVNVKAVVSTSPIKADFNILSKSVGGIRFMAMYDPRTIDPSEKQHYDLAIDQINRYFAQKKYRYIDRNRFLALQTEALKMMADHDTSMSYAQQLGFLADAQFIIELKDIKLESISEQFDTRSKSKVMIDVQAYDNCTAEGLGSITLTSDWQNASADNYTIKPGIASAVDRDFDNLLLTFSSYIGSWANNGTPFELRFYNSGGYRDLRDLRAKLKADPAFGGDFEIVSSGSYSKINCTYKKKADEMADKILDYADQVPTLAAKRLDVKLIFGRQISFAPQGTEIKSIKIRDAVKQTETKNAPTTKNPVKQTTDTPTTQTADQSTVAADPSKGSITVFTEAGEKFWLILNGAKINAKSAAKVFAPNLTEPNYKVKIIFENNLIPALSDNAPVIDFDGNIFARTFVVKKANNKFVMRSVSQKQVGGIKTQPENIPVNDPGVTPSKSNNTLPQQTSSVACTTAMSTMDFNDFIKQLRAQSFDETKVNMAKQATGANCMSVSQIKAVMKEISFEQSRLDYAKFAYSYTNERNKYYMLNDAFSFSSSVDELSNYVASQK